jgi:hypothetical protein
MYDIDELIDELDYMLIIEFQLHPNVFRYSRHAYLAIETLGWGWKIFCVVLEV